MLYLLSLQLLLEPVEGLVAPPEPAEGGGGVAGPLPECDFIGVYRLIF